MLKTIKIMLDYQCYPVWLYDENDSVIDTLLPEELRNDIELDKRFDSIQAQYDSLFIDNEQEFAYQGFESEEAKQRFLENLTQAVVELKEKLHGKYKITNEIKNTF